MKVEFNNLYTHFVFTTLNREPSIAEENRVRIEKYITGIINNKDCHLYAIYANPDHLHLLVSRSPNLSEEKLADIIANSTETFINNNKFYKYNFQWQESCSAFSVSKADVDKVCKYILKQPEHHKKQSCIDEYNEFLKFYQKTIMP
jgi:REP element-mobilizing transposase RayT